MLIALLRRAAAFVAFSFAEFHSQRALFPRLVSEPLWLGPVALRTLAHLPHEFAFALLFLARGVLLGTRFSALPFVLVQGGLNLLVFGFFRSQGSLTEVQGCTAFLVHCLLCLQGGSALPAPSHFCLEGGLATSDLLGAGSISIGAR